MKRLSLLFLVLIITVFASGAQAQTNDPMMQQMMDQMMRDPKMMQQMMDRMMADPKGRQAMMDAMSKNPEMMTQMMMNPEHCRVMAEQMSKDPQACKNMMEAMMKKTGPASGGQMMDMCSAMMQKKGSASSEHTSAAAPAAQYTIEVGSQFSPATINVKKGVPVRLNFRRSGKPTCASSVTFPTLGITRELPDNKTTAIDITPASTGDLTFSCGVGMLHGKLVVQ